jgi:Asp-tRNA(Asn)/Glu-tRNA(Gln) amidotransferase A subunit family amidase
MSESTATTVAHLAEAFRADADPVGVAEWALARAKKLDAAEQALGAFVALDPNDVLAQAAASSKRIAAGDARGPLEGVPVAIKDEFDVAGYPTGAGTRFLGKRPANADATVVARLREAGAVIFGKTTMTEIGLGGTGMNPATKTPRNPWDLGRLTGGSSSGSAAAVAAGVVPVALGSDAGGSIRMPAALCGIYGLKPTYGRIPTRGAALLAWSLDHLGPLGASIDDLAVFYDAVAGPDPDERESQFQPAPESTVGAPLDLAGRRFAWCSAFADDADPDVRESFHASLDLIRAAGATVDEVSVPRVETIQKVGYITIATEAAASQRDWLRDHRAEYNLDTRLLLAVAERFTAVDYLHAQRIRTSITRHFEELLADYDAFLNPTLACTAPPIPKAAFADGVVDTELNSKVSRYTFLGTITGLPGLTIPCGLPDGLPVGLHLMTGAFTEAKLLGLGRAVDDLLDPVGVPPVYDSPI